MKTCPICGAGAFDDATTCFGCLHRYDEPSATCAPLAHRLAGPPLEVARPAEAVRSVVDSHSVLGAAPAVTRTIRREESGWVVQFELPGLIQGGCEAFRVDPASARETCDLLVRFQPTVPDAPGRADGAAELRPLRGSHARAIESGEAAGTRDARTVASLSMAAPSPREQVSAR